MAPTVIWQITRWCDVDCRGCVAAAEGKTPSDELSTFEGYKTIDQIVMLNPARLIISGGDPLTRNDITQLLDYARRRGLKPSVAMSPTRKLTPETIETLLRYGASTLIFSLNGSSPELHDAIFATPGSFAATVRAMRWAREASVAVEVNTLVTRRNMGDLAAIADILMSFDIVAWNVYFLVPIAAAANLEVISAAEAEQVFYVLAEIAARAQFTVRTVEAPQYRRFVLQQWGDFAGYVGGTAIGAVIDDVVFIGSRGDVRPSEFLPVAAGNLRYRPLSFIYRAADLFAALRDRSNLKGKCARCEYRQICGGSRARAWASTGDLFASDPLCAYQPV